MKMATTILLFVLCSVPSVAHPGTALVIDNEKNVYFAYWGGTWKMDSKGHLERIHSNDFHFLAIDMSYGFANMKLPDMLRITPDGSMPAPLASALPSTLIAGLVCAPQREAPTGRDRGQHGTDAARH